MLEEIVSILFPYEKIEIYVIPAKDGCHQDNFWIKITNNNTTATIIGVLITAFFAYPLTYSQIKVNKSEEELNQLLIEETRARIEAENLDSRITDEQYRRLIESPIIKNNRSKHFKQLQDDLDIQKEEFVAKYDQNTIQKKAIPREEFGNYIHNLEQIRSTKIVEKVHELTVIKSVNDHEYKDLMWMVQDINGKYKFGAHMCDEEFYDSHLKNVLGLKNLLVKMRYTLHENQTGKQIIKNKEIVTVYRYNETDRIDLPKDAVIEPAPLEIWNTKNDDFVSLNKSSVNKNQIPLF